MNTYNAQQSAADANKTCRNRHVPRHQKREAGVYTLAHLEPGDNVKVLLHVCGQDLVDEYIPHRAPDCVC